MSAALSIQPGTVTHIPIELLARDPKQPRSTFNPSKLRKLAADIGENGVMQPITVRRNPKRQGHFLIVYGERRFRASKLAKLPTVPALLADERVGDDVARLLNQVKENHLREDLNAIEWANIIRALHKEHGLKLTEVATKLKEEHVDNMSRTTLSNIMRLLDLPEWAQTLIQKNTITASHGKYLLQAMASTEVMNAIYQRLIVNKETLTTRQLQDATYELFLEKHKDLKGKNTHFNFIPDCTSSGCTEMRKLHHSRHGETVFCLKTPCFNQKNASPKRENQTKYPEPAHQETKKQTPITNSRTPENGNQPEMFEKFIFLKENAEFNLNDCRDCRQMKAALHQQNYRDACYDIHCFNRKQETYLTNIRHLTTHLRKQISEQLAGEHPALSLRLLAWIAAHGPSGQSNSITDFTFPEMINLEQFETTLSRHGMTTINDFLEPTNGSGAFVDIAKVALHDIDWRNIISLALFIDVDASGFRISTELLTQYEDTDIIQLLNDAGVNLTEEDSPRDIAIKNAETIGAPPGILWIWQKETQGARNE